MLILVPFLGTVSPAVIRANVVAGLRPVLSDDDDCIEGYRKIIIRCWDKRPDGRLHFKGK